MSDPRIETLRDLVTNLKDCPADQSDDVLVAASQLGAELKGLADVERLTRATTDVRLARWWEDSTPARGRQGDIVSPAGRTAPIPCPKCKRHPVVYNGNYFCDDYHAPALSPDGQGGSCDWALAHPAKSKRDRAICDLIGIDYD